LKIDPSTLTLNINIIINNFNSSTTYASILDFKKAFDKVPHLLLTEKIRRIKGINHFIANWTQSLLTDRSQKVVIKESESSELGETPGIVQGSVLGPTLFLTYINDLPQSVSCKVSLYTDDTLLYAEVNNEIQQRAFQRGLNSLHSWSLKWKIPLNTNKCEAIISGKTNDTSHLYSLGGTTLKTVKEAKYLGAIMQSNLKFDRHITSKVNNASKILGCIKHKNYNASMKAKLIAYLGLCRPILEYADTLRDPTTKVPEKKMNMFKIKPSGLLLTSKGVASVMLTLNYNLKLLPTKRP